MHRSFLTLPFFLLRHQNRISPGHFGVLTATHAQRLSQQARAGSRQPYQLERKQGTQHAPGQPLIAWAAHAILSLAQSSLGVSQWSSSRYIRFTPRDGSTLLPAVARHARGGLDAAPVGVCCLPNMPIPRTILHCFVASLLGGALRLHAAQRAPWCASCTTHIHRPPKRRALAMGAWFPRVAQLHAHTSCQKHTRLSDLCQRTCVDKGLPWPGPPL